MNKRSPFLLATKIVLIALTCLLILFCPLQAKQKNLDPKFSYPPKNGTITGLVIMEGNWIDYSILSSDGKHYKLKADHAWEFLADYIDYHVSLTIKSGMPTGIVVEKGPATDFPYQRLKLKEGTLYFIDKESAETLPSYPELDLEEMANVYNSVHRIFHLDEPEIPFALGQSPLGPIKNKTDIARTQCLILSGTDVTDDQFAVLSKLPNLALVLKLRHCDKITEKCAESFKNVKRIDYLTLDSDFWTPELFLKSFTQTKLKVLTLINRSIDTESPAWKEFLAMHPELKFKVRYIKKKKKEKT